MIQRLFYCLVFTLLANGGVAQEPAAKSSTEDKVVGFEKWEKNITALEKKAAANPAAKESILFVGSSSIYYWDLPQSFPNLKTLNHGFGGSQIADSVHFFDRVVLPTAPKTIVFYAGDNDIAAGKSPEQVFADFQAFAALVKEKLPAARMIYIAIKPSPARWKLFDQQIAANRLIREAIEKEPSRLVFLDIVKPMLDDNSQPNAALFKKDMLHMNPDGYAIWNALLLPHLTNSSIK